MGKGILYLCATPIGNLSDITFRCLEILKHVDLIACEDTRRTLKLLNYYEISKPLVSYYEHNKNSKGLYLLSRLEKGENIALVSDAGTPAISDPGEDLVKLCIENEIEIISVPGACAAVNALIVSGMSTGRFCFEGFLTTKKANRHIHLKQIENENRTMIFYEAPHKLLKTLKDLREYLGNRKITIAREMTKKFEEKIRTDFDNAIINYEKNTPKGEFVIIVEGKAFEEVSVFEDNLTITEAITALIEKGIDTKQAIKDVAQQRKIPKREVYNEWVKKDS